MSFVRSYMTWQTTPYLEVAPGSPEFSFSKGHSRSVRHYWIPWKEFPIAPSDVGKSPMWIAARDFLGYSEIKFAANGTKYISRHVPHSFAGLDGFFYADDVQRIDGLISKGQDAQGVGTFDEAKMSVVYTAPMFQIMTDAELMSATSLAIPDEATLERYVTTDMEPSGKYQTLPSVDSLSWDVQITGKPTTYRFPMLNQQQVLLCEGEMVVQWEEVPLRGFPLQAILNTVGKTNNALFGNLSSVAGLWPKGRLLCLFPKRKVYRMANGDFAQTITYRFKIYPNGANSFFWTGPTLAGAPLTGTILSGPRINFSGALTPGFYPAVRTTGKPLFEEADFNALFRPE